MKVLSAVMLFLILTEVLCDGADLSDERNFSAGTNPVQEEWLSSDPLMLLRRLTRKPRPQQFFGLMGRRSTRQKLNSFVGLMGKRHQMEPGLFQWSTIQNYEKSQ
ncbi:protachykinin-like [Scleropages formosus]|uniref:protachykinin-like n=1 Tax=Scleropages formosus TaxID=113540 RepID=UPI0008787E6A|nr:protachykinin-like [Scleropages formosus]